MSEKVSEDSLFPLFDEIVDFFHYKESEGTKWKKMLSDNLYDTLDSIDDLPSEDWEAMEIPFKVLIELKKRYTPLMKKPNDGKKNNFESLKNKEQSFQDLSQFMRTTRTLSDDRKNKKWKVKAKKATSPLKKLSTYVNIVGREGHPFQLISTFFGGGLSEDKPLKNYNAEISIYGYDVIIDIYDCAVSNSETPDSIVIVFARENLNSLHRMLEKWIQTKDKPKIPVILASIDTNKKNTKAVSYDQSTDFLKEFNGIRYFEISTQEDAKDLFTEVAKIKIRAAEIQPKDISLNVQKILDKKTTDAAFRKKGLSLLPNTIYSITPFVQKLRLECNSFKFFPLEVFYFSQLQELNLSMNQLEEIPPEISCLTNLVKLEIEYNLLESLPLSSIQSLKNLVELKAKGNPFSKLPDELKGKIIDLLPSIRGFLVKEESELDLRSFGVPLKSLLLVEKKLYHLRSIPVLPKIVLESVNFLLKFGIQLEGIFRIAGQNVRCVALKESIDSGLVKFVDSENPHDVSNVFKQWLRELPEPVFLFSNFNRILAIANLSEEEKMKELKRILHELPQENFQLLKQIFRLMYIVGLNSETNRMDFGNITKVVCPNLIYSKIPQQDPFKTMSDITTINDVLLNITQNFPAYFEENVNLLQTESLLPDKPIAVFYRKIFGHTKSIMATSMSSDLKLLWTVDSRGFVKIWSTSDLALIQSIDTKKRRINCIVNHSNKMWIGTIDGVEVRDENTGEHIADLSSLSAFTITTACNHVWVGDARVLHIYNVENFKCTDISVASEPLTLATANNSVWGACRDNKIRVWNAETFELISEFDTKHESKVSSISEIAGNVWSWDNSSIFVWDKDFNHISTFEKTHKVFGAKIILNNAWTFSWKGDIHLYNASNFEHKGEVYTYHNDAISSIEVVYDENFRCYKVFTASWDKSIICWLLKIHNRNELSDRRKKKERKRKKSTGPNSLPSIVSQSTL